MRCDLPRVHGSAAGNNPGVNGSRKLHIFGNRKILTLSVRSYPEAWGRSIVKVGGVGHEFGAGRFVSWLSVKLLVGTDLCKLIVAVPF